MYYNRLECVNIKTGEKFIVWQRVDGDSVTYVGKEDQPFKMPKVYEAVVVEDELERPE